MKTTVLGGLLVVGCMLLGIQTNAQTTTMDDQMTDSSMQKMMSPKKMMKAIDQNDDKMISMGEAESADNPMLADNFSMADTSKDDMLDMKELKAYHKKMKKDMKKGMNDEKMNMKQEVDSMSY